MQTVSFPGFLTLSLLGIHWEATLTEDPIDHVTVVEQSKITCCLGFLGEHWFDRHQGEQAKDVVRYFCLKFKARPEYIGENTWILKETMSGGVKNTQKLLRARARSIQGISRMLSKQEQCNSFED